MLFVKLVLSVLSRSMNEFANASFDAIVCCQAGLEWITMDDVGRYNFRPRYNFNVTPPANRNVDVSRQHGSQ